ncbi:MAG: hypothetical protein ABL962_07125 [Fimbriimonadaceae bacterium]
MILALVIVASLNPNRANFGIVFGAEVGKSSPGSLVRVLGKGVGEVRHFKLKGEIVRDDGWDWWDWRAGNANVQSYWSPAFPISKRRIERITICERFGKGPSIAPSTKLSGWLAGLKIGMPKEQCLDKMVALFGSPHREFGQYVWASKTHYMYVSCDPLLSEIVIISR